MELNFIITQSHLKNVITVKTSGKMNAGGFIAMAKELLRHPGWVPNGNVIFDHQNLDRDGVQLPDLQGIRSFHEKNEQRIGNGRSAIVLKSEFLEKWQQLWSQGEKIKTANIIQVFGNYSEAIDWLTQ